jgi:hypothetical protein
MKIELKNTPEQQVLFKAMANSKRKSEAIKAQEMFAQLVAPRIGQVLDQADTTALVYRSFTYNADDNPTMPVEPLLGIGENHLSTWSNSVAGGLASNRVYQPIEEIQFTNYRLDSAISWNKRYAAKARLDVISLYLTRLAQEILVKRNRNAWSVVLAALAAGSNGGIANVKKVDNSGLFTLDDLNHLFTRIVRQNLSWVGGSPTQSLGKLTDLIMSPEVYEQIRAFAYNPVQTLGALGGAATGTNIALPDAQRAAMFAGGGIESLFGVRLQQMVELGVGGKYTTLFDELSTQTYTEDDGSNGATFNATTDDLIIGLDLTRDFAWRAIAQDPEDNSTFSLVADDQFVGRSEVIGFYGWENMGHIVTDTHAIQGLVV